MKKVAILLPQFGNPEWIAIAVHAFKSYEIPIDSEIIVIDNSPDKPWIRVLTETSLGEGIRIVNGRTDFPSHAYGYKLGLDSTDADWIFTSESDSFPTRHGFFDEFIKASVNHDLIGPVMPMASGRFVHPAGSLVSRRLLDAHREWRNSVSGWKLCPGAAIMFGLSDRGYHVVAKEEFLDGLTMTDDMRREIELWSDVGPWQEMRSFDDDSFDSYGQRTRIENWGPISGKNWHLRIGYEPGQHLSYFAESEISKRCGFNVFYAPCHIEWMLGYDGRQAAYSTVFGGYKHVWCGTSSVLPGIEPPVRDFKIKQRDDLVAALPVDVRKKISQLQS